MDAFNFTTTVASRGCRVCKTTSQINAKVGDKVTVELETTASSLETNPCACGIRIKNKYFSSLITVEHISRETSWHVYFFIMTEGGKVNGHVNPLTCRPSFILSGGLEIPLQLTFLCRQREILDIMNAFVNSLYDWNYIGIIDQE